MHPRTVYSIMIGLRILSIAARATGSTGVASIDGATAGLQAIFGWAAAMLFLVAGSLFIWHHNRSNMHSHMLSGTIEWIMNGAMFVAGFTFLGWIGLAVGATVE